MNSDFKELLSLFNANNVEYLLVGGVAYIFYAEPRYTKDLDVWIKADPGNAQNVYRALRQFGAPLSSLNAEDFAKEGFFYTMGVAPVRVDILMSIDGVRFEDAWPKRVRTSLEEVEVWIISHQDLITAKLAAGRPQDLLDVANLRAAIPSPETFQIAPAEKQSDDTEKE